MSDATLPVRATDPDTSVAAAAKATAKAATIRPIVLELVREHGPVTHEELIGHYQFLIITKPGTPRASESGIRTRLNELVKRGLVTRTNEESHSRYGNRAKLWISTDVMAGLIVDEAGEPLLDPSNLITT